MRFFTVFYPVKQRLDFSLEIHISFHINFHMRIHMEFTPRFWVSTVGPNSAKKLLPFRLEFGRGLRHIWPHLLSQALEGRPPTN